MSSGAVDEIQKRLGDQGVEFLFGSYVDMFGVPKSKCVPLSFLGDMAAGSERYTVGALEGMGELGPNEDECCGIPDLTSVTVLPWDKRFAIAPADLTFDGAPYSHDSRHVLKRQLDQAAAAGFSAQAGIEPEVYVLKEDENGQIEPWITDDLLNAPTRGYDIEATLAADQFLLPMVAYMNELGWNVYSFDHEGGDGQYEFAFTHCDALEMADRMVIFRLMAKHVARELGCFATFMPKPFDSSFGSGAHVNMSLVNSESGENIFATDNGDGTVTYLPAAYQFTAGLLKHAGAITALACSTVNSYKRLLPVGLMNEISWAPVFQAFGDNNRTLMCRLPTNRPCVELRTADSASNCYLVMAMMLAAGLDGIKDQLDPGQPVNTDTYQMTDDELAAAGVNRLPRNLGEATDAFEASELAKEVLGDEFHATFIKKKREEWLSYNTVVGGWERDMYLRLW
ncbi:MAG: hypothetical protein WCK97_09015 [Actinomycetes bacterium]